MDVSAYLRRIGISEPVMPTKDTLFRLQKAHLLSVPYENLDILAGVPLSLKGEDLFHKIVVKGRGGYCFELNELFGRLLRALGYEVEDYFARFLADEPEIPMRRHHVLAVRVPGEAMRYLADVGVGTGSPNLPVEMVAGVLQPQGGDLWRLVKDDFLGWVLEREKKGVWKRIFSFTEEKQLPIDFVAASFYCEKSPDSIFNKQNMVALRTESGRKTLDGDEFRIFHDGEVTVYPVSDAAERARMLQEWFAIDLTR